jgi:hypothetical protein
MKRKISLLFFFAIGTVMFLASYRTKDSSRVSPSRLLTSHSWRFEKAESLSDRSAAVVNSVYANSQYNFTPEKTYQGEFFDHPIQGTWSMNESDELVLNQGTEREEKMEIAMISDELLKVRVMEKGTSVTLIYKQ